MRIVDFYEFCNLPEGTVFSYWDGEVANSLFRRGEVIFEGDRPIDFFEACLIAEKYTDQPPAIDLIEGRWAMFDYDQKFAVYESNDIDAIAEGLGLKDERDAIEQKIEDLKNEIECLKQLHWGRLSEAEKDAAIRMS